VAAGFRVRLVDVDLDGRIDLDALAQARLDRVAGLVVCNLFGRAEELGPLSALARSRGFELIDDAAQALGARDAEGQLVGQRGFPSVLSFGRGKPLQGLGGGAVLGLARDETPVAESAHHGAVGAPFATSLKAVALSAVWNASLTRPVFSLLSRIPALGIGQTEFEPGFESGPIDPARAAIAAAQLSSFDERTAARRIRARALASRLEKETGFVPLMDVETSDRGVYSRLALRAPHAEARERALVELAEIGAGASALYPNSLADVPELEPHRVSPSDADVPQSRALASRVLTLPTNRTRDAADLDQVLRCLIAASEA
jgi:dTDP-4-amino-4,6-dideoxygalactose transaminase